ncbi:signal recognition particle protein Srp19 [Candidatus Bathyarchaeota archaeon]|nr:MAG: signal recognition particle protein Srp19 [Candidatus Bathyarchaeota archaeon]
MRRRGRLIIWPIYLDASYSRSLGRRVPLKLALRDVRAEEVYQAASQLGLNPELQADAAYPRTPWRRTGLVLIDKEGSKTRLLRELAEAIRRMRRKGRI